MASLESKQFYKIGWKFCGCLWLLNFALIFVPAPAHAGQSTVSIQPPTVIEARLIAANAALRADVARLASLVEETAKLTPECPAAPACRKLKVWQKEHGKMRWHMRDVCEVGETP